MLPFRLDHPCLQLPLASPLSHFGICHYPPISNPVIWSHDFRPCPSWKAFQSASSVPFPPVTSRGNHCIPLLGCMSPFLIFACYFFEVLVLTWKDFLRGSAPLSSRCSKSGCSTNLTLPSHTS